MKQNFQEKCWNRVEKKLRTLQGNIYYIGGTLSVGLTPETGIALNLDGTGFVFGKIQGKNDQVCQPPHILELVRKIYRDKKGINDHYRRKVAA